MSITRLTTNGLTGTKYDTVSADNYYMEPIATTVVGAGTATSVDFTNIPQGYKHLQIRYIDRNAAVADATRMRFNSDTGSNYAFHQLQGNGSTAAAATGSNATSIEIPFTAYSGTTANAFAVGVIDILDYSNVYKYKTTRSLGGADLNGSGRVDLASGLWMNTAGITSISIFAFSGNIAQYSRFSLYGIKG